MHEMLTTLTNVCGVCQSVCHVAEIGGDMQSTPRAVCMGSFGAAFAKCFWPLVCVGIK